MNIIDFSVKRPVAGSMIMLVLLFLGVAASWMLPVDSMPKIDNPVLRVSASYPGAGPAQVESGVTRPLEAALSGLEDVDEIHSYSREGSATVTIRYDWGVDINKAIFDVREKLNYAELPDAVNSVRIFKYSNDDDPVLGVMIAGIHDHATAYDFADYIVKRDLESIPGVGDISVSGGKQTEIHIQLYKNRLSAYNINADDVASLVRQNNVTASGGYIQHGAYRFGVRTDGQLASLRDFRNIVVAFRNNTPIFLQDIADVYYGAFMFTDVF